MRDARLPVLQGLRAGLQGRSDLETPANWREAYARLQNDEELAPVALEIAQLFGDAKAVQTMLASLNDAGTSVEERRRAVNGLASQQREELIPYLEALIDDPVLRVEAIRAVAAFEETDLGAQLLARFDGYSVAEQNEALQTLASRPVYGRQLTRAISDATIDRSVIPAYIARQLRRVVGNGFVEIWGPIDDLALRNEAAYAKYRALLTEEAIASADPAQGRQVFGRTCGTCHVMYGEGGRVGPELTGSNRANLDYILSNILNPSEEIQDDYRMAAVTTHDGRTYLGNITADTERQVTLRVVGQDAVVIDRADIESLEVTTASLMPEGLLDTLSDEQVLDLIAYLRTTEPVGRPSE
jgi:putative heme-binding domain-containing protein